MDEQIEILGMTSADFAAWARRRIGAGSGLAPRLYTGIFKTGRIEPEALGAGAATARLWRELISAELLEVAAIREEPGEFGTTSKALLVCADGSEIECVRIPMPSREGEPRRNTLCVSSQVGCRMGCAFCETGRPGLTRNLRPGEIVAQYLTARLRLGWEIGNVVFMGMGEPLDNLEQVAAAIRVLNDSRGPALAWDRITLCSSCPPGGIEALRGLGFKRLNFSVSLNAGSDETRRALMPVGRGESLAALAAELAAYSQRRNFVLGLNYCLIPGLNDSAREAEGVGRFCRAVGRCIVNLIPYNPGTAALARTPAEDEIEAFAGLLRAAGCDVRRRTRKGGSIMAGCGQLGSRPSL